MISGDSWSHITHIIYKPGAVYPGWSPLKAKGFRCVRLFPVIVNFQKQHRLLFMSVTFVHWIMKYGGLSFRKFRYLMIFNGIASIFKSNLFFYNANSFHNSLSHFFKKGLSSVCGRKNNDGCNQ